MYKSFFKRFFDIIFSMLALLLLWWVMVIVALLVRIELGSPVIFKQDRPGRINPKTGKERIFKLYKFRSMTDKRDENDELLPDKQRLTKFGRILRKTSLDELPELWNILTGDMSIVGPRPLLVKYLDFYNDFEHRRHTVRPGLTGLAQVSGRNALTWAKRFELDNEYIDHLTLWMDIKVLFMTVAKVFKHEGVEFNEGHQSIFDYFEEKREYETTNK